jgi:hypothetical protein
VKVWLLVEVSDLGGGVGCGMCYPIGLGGTSNVQLDVMMI